MNLLITVLIVLSLGFIGYGANMYINGSQEVKERMLIGFVIGAATASLVGKKK